MPPKDKLSHKIGKGLAHVQSFVDDALHGAFNFLKKKGKSNSAPPNPDAPATDKLKHGLKKTANFLGETGDAYYNKYDELKAKNKKSKSKK